MSKMKCLKLSYPHAVPAIARNPSDDRSYRVEQVTDSVRYTPGELLLACDVEDLCDSRDWRVTIVPARGRP